MVSGALLIQLSMPANSGAGAACAPTATKAAAAAMRERIVMVNSLQGWEDGRDVRGDLRIDLEPDRGRAGQHEHAERALQGHGMAGHAAHALDDGLAAVDQRQ